MMLGYVAGATGLAFLGQQTGAQMLDAALNGDLPSTEAVINQANQIAGTGVSVETAAVLVGVVPLAYKLLQMATPFTETVNLWWRKKMLGEDKPPID